MKLETFFQKFDLFADAPDAVAKMRELVIQWAVQGKLVNSNDSSASNLLAEITERNEDHVADFGARKPEGEKSKDKAPAPLPCPQNWRTVPLHSLTDWRYPISYGVLKPGEFDPNGVRLVKSQNVLNGSIGGDIDFKITPQLDEEYKRTRLKGGEILLNVVGSLGRCAVVPPSLSGANVSRAVAVITLDPGLSAEYIELQLRALLSVGVLADLRTGSAQPVLNLSIVRQLPINLPPLAEQKRIVAKVDELMALCDRLEAQQQERETRHAALARASLARFAEAPTAAHLKYLFHDSVPIPPADLRKAILTLAVQGKLVPQDPNDEPADVLLARIRRKKGGAVEDVSGTEEMPILKGGFTSPFEIPTNWAWSRATEPTFSISDFGKKIKTKDVSEKGRFPVVDQGKQFIRGYCDDEEKVIHLDTPIVLFGDHTRETKLIDFDFIVGADGVKLLKPIEINPGYYLLALRWLPLDDRGYGRHFKLLRAASIPIPPLAEQRRIVAKVEQLMALVDALERQLADGRATAEKLLSALVAELTGTKSTGQASKPAGTGRRGRPRKST